MRTEKQIANDLTAIAVAQIKHPTETMFFWLAKRKALADMGREQLPAYMVAQIFDRLSDCVAHDNDAPSPEWVEGWKRYQFTPIEIKSVEEWKQ